MTSTLRNSGSGLQTVWSVTGSQKSYFSLMPASNLYSFTSFIFSNAGATGNVGPTYSQVKTAYAATAWTQNQAYLDVVTQGYQLWTVPTTASYTIVCAGAAGGRSSTYSSGYGNVISTTVSLVQGDKINICVGQVGTTGGSIDAGGGGGSFVVWSNGTPIVIAGGGGGTSAGYPTGGPGKNAVSTTSGTTDGAGQGTGGTSGSGGITALAASFANTYGHGGGGGGFSGDGTTITAGTPAYHGKGGLSFANGLVGGARGGTTVLGGNGGFGGGGGSGGTNGDTRSSSGGGGGYSGGAGGTIGSATNGGGGGGSYSISTITVVGVCTSNGYVKITRG